MVVGQESVCGMCIGERLLRIFQESMQMLEFWVGELGLVSWRGQVLYFV